MLLQNLQQGCRDSVDLDDSVWPQQLELHVLVLKQSSILDELEAALPGASNMLVDTDGCLLARGLVHNVFLYC